MDRSSTACQEQAEFPAELRGALRARDPEVLEMFFDHYFTAVYAFVRRMVGSTAEAEDITQDVFIRVHAGLPKYDPARDPRPWLFTIAANEVRTSWRRAQAGVRGKTQGTVNEHDAVVERDALTDLTERELDDRVRGAVDRLPEGMRVPVLLRIHEGLSFEVIGRAMDLPAVTVRKRYSRAITRLRELLDPAISPAASAVESPS